LLSIFIRSESHAASAGLGLKLLSTTPRKANGYSSALQGGWTGQAATAFNGTYEAFSADFAKVLNALQVMQEKLASTQATYTTTEDTTTSQVGRIAGLLNT